MALSESLFGWLHRSWRRAPGVPDHAAQLARLEVRLSALAHLLGGRDFEVRTAEGSGGYGGRTLWLPSVIAGCRDRIGNELAYVYRVAFGVVALDPPGLVASGDAERDALIGLLGVPTIAARLHARWPGAQELTRSLSPLVVELLEAQRGRDARQGAAANLLRRLCSLPASTAREPAVTAWSTRAAEVAQGPLTIGAVDALLAAWRRLPGRLRLAELPLWLWGQPMPAPSGASAGGPTDPDALPTGSERAGKAREKVVEVRPEADRGDNPLVHVFEKLITAEEYQGGSKPLDGADELAEHGDALDELDLRHVIRSRERTGSLLRADVSFVAGGFDVADTVEQPGDLHYDEWDERSRSYRRGWCVVRVRPPRQATAAAASAAAASRARLRRQIDALRARLMQLDRSRTPCLRQRDGEDLDIDAVVDYQAALLGARRGAGRTDEGRLYVARRRRNHDVAVLLLIDASLSTDAWVDGRRVLDVAREAVLLAGEAFADLGMRIGVAAFHSHTRRDCEFAVLKDFVEPWPASRARLYALQPQGYTRIGPALRHGAQWLARTAARRRLLVLLSDGKPMDYDRYEGRYGMADVRQAVREMARIGVQPMALAIDPTSKRHLPAMFERGSFAVLPSAKHLPLRLATLLAGMR